MSLVVAKKTGPHGMLLVVSDKDILGRKFDEGRVQLDLTKQFYQGDVLSKDEVKELINQSRHLHLTGKEAVALAVEMDLIDTSNILWVKKVPHVEVVMGE